jgi:hypothetical protein
MSASAIVIDHLNLTTRNKRDLRHVAWLNDALLTLLNLYEEKYLAFDCGFFLTKD